jgi:hypothetical protein
MKLARKHRAPAAEVVAASVEDARVADAVVMVAADAAGIAAVVEIAEAEAPVAGRGRRLLRILGMLT